MGWNEMVDAILSLKQFAFSLADIVIKLIKAFPKILSVFNYVTDPSKLIKDIVFALKTGFIMIWDATIGAIIGSLTKNFYLGSGDDEKKGKKTKKCFNKSLINIMILVLCPPLAIFMDKGMEGFFNIIIASFLTYFYYFPGLIYSSLYII